MAFYCSKWFQEFTVRTDGSSVSLKYRRVVRTSSSYMLNFVRISMSCSSHDLRQTWKYSKFGHFSYESHFLERFFSKPLLPTQNKRTANGRLIFPLTKSDLIRKLADENLYMNNNTSALNNNTPVKLNNAPLETHPLEKSFATAANFIAAKCISCQTFA